MITIIAIDDESVALSIVSKFCERRGGIKLETYTVPQKGLARIQELRPDIVMLDIEMNGMSGLDIGHQLPDSTCLIITTAYSHYAVDGYDMDAVDFLQKPYFYERFVRAIEKAERWLVARDLMLGTPVGTKNITVKAEYKNISIPTDIISYVESLENYVCIHKIDGTKLKSKVPLHVVESMLPSEDFVRIHRSYLIARHRVQNFTSTEVSISGEDRPLPIGKKYADGFKTVMMRQ